MFTASCSSVSKAPATSKRGLQPGSVVLNVYDIPNPVIANLNAVLRTTIGIGAFHAGVEIFGWEWSFSSSPGPNSTGIFCCRPRSSRRFVYRESIFLGATTSSESRLMQCMDELVEDWPASMYHFLQRNCLHFCDAFC